MAATQTFTAEAEIEVSINEFSTDDIIEYLKEEYDTNELIEKLELKASAIATPMSSFYDNLPEISEDDAISTETTIEAMALQAFAMLCYKMKSPQRVIEALNNIP